MSNLKKHEGNPISDAMQAPKIRQHENITERLKEIYRMCLMLAGHTNFNPYDVKVQVQLLEQQLKSKYSGITLEELSYLSSKGAVGDYGDNHGINPAAFIRWVKEYLGSHERKEALKTLKNEPKKIEEKKQLTLDEKRELWNDRKEHFNKTGSLIGEVKLYAIGKELGLIDETDEMFIEEVRFHAIKWFETEKLELLQSGGLAKKFMISKIKEILDASDEDRSKSGLWINRCKRIAVGLTMR